MGSEQALLPRSLPANRLQLPAAAAPAPTPPKLPDALAADDQTGSDERLLPFPSLQSVGHINMDLRMVNPKAEGRSKKVSLVVWHGGRKHVACLRTVKSLIENMITGVTKGFRYKMKAVYAHFPVNIIINDGGKSVEIRNFLGEKVRRQNSA